MLQMMTLVYRKTGFPELEKQMVQQLLSFNNDSLEFLNNMVMLENWQGNYQVALKYGLEIWSMDSTDSYSNLILAVNYVYLNDLYSALKHVRIYENINIRMKGEFQPTGFTGYIHMMNGNAEEAYLHYQGVISMWQKQFELNTPLVQANRGLHELADVYLALGEKEKALKYLKVLKTLQTIDLVHITVLKSWPGFDIIRNEPEFQDILKVIEATYQKEHLRIEKLLIREGMIKS
jgi:tetratricopeptide (TPR) repeat protein